MSPFLARLFTQTLGSRSEGGDPAKSSGGLVLVSSLSDGLAPAPPLPNPTTRRTAWSSTSVTTRSAPTGDARLTIVI